MLEATKKAFGLSLGGSQFSSGLTGGDDSSASTNLVTGFQSVGGVLTQELQEKFFPSIIALTALAVSASAAFYSVYGFSKLFAGASLQVIIMTGTLEVAKLVIASLLYQYWSTINKILRLYLLKHYYY